MWDFQDFQGVQGGLISNRAAAVSAGGLPPPAQLVRVSPATYFVVDCDGDGLLDSVCVCALGVERGTLLSTVGYAPMGPLRPRARGLVSPVWCLVADGRRRQPWWWRMVAVVAAWRMAATAVSAWRMAAVQLHEYLVRFIARSTVIVKG